MQRVAPAQTPELEIASQALPDVPLASALRPASAAPPLSGSAGLRPRSRWSGSAWLLVRGDGESPLAPGGTLGASQAGVRIAYRINGDATRPLALSGRFYSPLGRGSGAEAALGLDWRPLARVPVHVLAERRQAVGRHGRSALALAIYGGLSERALPGDLRLDLYGQAGVVGARSRDLFADGAAVISLSEGDLRIGAGLWGGAQPGAARLDVGPQLSAPFSIAGERLRVSAQWRLRIAGEASPGSGPALTLGTDF